MGKQVERRLGSALVTHPGGQTNPRRPESIGKDEWKTRLGSTWLTNGVCWCPSRNAKAARYRSRPCGTGLLVTHFDFRGS
jgi:hypothetical protein